jgi:triacylglycerol esterase/lipase EstA (alpha/beta hydrolase family)
MNIVLRLAIVTVCIVLQLRVAAQPDSNQWVVLIHGMGRSSISLKKMDRGLRKAGYHVVNVRFPARRCSVETLADTALAQTMREDVPTNATRVDFVTHSLGGIVLRQYWLIITLRIWGGLS